MDAFIFQEPQYQGETLRRQRRVGRSQLEALEFLGHKGSKPLGGVPGRRPEGQGPLVVIRPAFFIAQEFRLRKGEHAGLHDPVPAGFGQFDDEGFQGFQDIRSGDKGMRCPQGHKTRFGFGFPFLEGFGRIFRFVPNPALGHHRPAVGDDVLLPGEFRIDRLADKIEGIQIP